MKRFIALMLSLMLFVLPFAPFAKATGEPVNTEYFEDGSYIIIGSDEYTDIENAEDTLSFIGRIIQAIKKLINLLFGKSDVKTSQDEKYVHYYDKNGTRLWSVYLEGKFTYNGQTSKCTDADVRYYIYDSDWEMLYCKADKSGATATASFKIRQQKLGVPLKTIEKTVSITCDKNGKAR